MRTKVAALVAFTTVALSIASCDRTSGGNQGGPTPKQSEKATSASRLGDLSTSLADVRAAFNARKGQARFLTLLSPT
jgi:hypothetical protein